jgi:valyl-tRNA synthetase
MNDMGTDAVRFTMLVGSTPGVNTNLSLQKVEANRNFANKVWNAGRFVIGTLENLPGSAEDQPDWTLADSWVWAKLQDLIRNVDRLFNSHQYGEAGRYIYDFFWGDYADWYLEIAKHQIGEGGDRAYHTVETLIKVLDLCLRLLHPFTPFVTEELWQHLRRAVLDSPLEEIAADWPEALMIASWPEPREPEDWETDKTTEFELIQEVIRTIRNLRSEKNIKPGKLIPAKLIGGDYTPVLKDQVGSLISLAFLDPQKTIIATSVSEIPASDIALVAGPVEIYLPLSGLVDLEEEKQRLSSELAELTNEIKRLEELLAGPFAHKAPQAVVEKEREKLTGYQETASTLQDQIANLEGVS